MDASSPPVEPSGELIPSDFGERVKGALGDYVSPAKLDQATEVVSTLVAEVYSGPIPHPQHLRAFEEVCPGAAHRIIEMAEREQGNRHRQENNDFSYGVLGQLTGFLFAITTVIAAVVAGYLGAQGVGIALASVGVLGTVGYFIRGNSFFSSDKTDSSDTKDSRVRSTAVRSQARQSNKKRK